MDTLDIITAVLAFVCVVASIFYPIKQGSGDREE